MAYYTIKFFSNALRRNVTFDMVIPNDEREDAPAEQNAHTRRRMKTILLLHGYTGDASTFGLEEEAVKYNFALVMPNGENGFYLDGEATGQKYASYVGIELINYVRKTFGLAMTPEETYVTGLSMGGFGALHTALSYPERFGKAACLSSALINSPYEAGTVQRGGKLCLLQAALWRSGNGRAKGRQPGGACGEDPEGGRTDAGAVLMLRNGGFPDRKEQAVPSFPGGAWGQA